MLLWLPRFVEHLEQMSRDPQPVVQLPLVFRNVRQMHQTRVETNFNRGLVAASFLGLYYMKR
jgi:hypothetical protein